jgi:hypothetical protein
LWIPLLPLGSYRVRPTGKGTNAVVYHSLNFQTVRVPLCWPQVRNVYIFAAPILALIIYFSWPDIQKWWKYDVMKSSTTRLALKQEPQSYQPAESELPLTSKQASAACGKVLKLDKTAFVKLDLINRLPQVVDRSGFTDEEIKLTSADELRDEVFEAYSLAFLTWEKPAELSRATLDKNLIKTLSSVDQSKLSIAERMQYDAYVVKFKRMLLNAFDLGRRDARISPCP